MTPRERRLLSDLRQMEELARGDEIAFRAEGTLPEKYEVMFSVRGLARDSDGQLALRGLHRCALYLHLDYPRRPPVVAWLTPVFHPNLLPPSRNGGVCIGSWSAAESLADLCLRLRDLVSYRSLNFHDALDAEAGAWAERHDVQPGTDLELLVTLPLGAQIHVLSSTAGAT
jgi:ubiquitin-protein ligase